MAAALVIFHFFAPFIALVMRANKRTPRSLAVVALAVVAFHYIDIYWLVKPSAAWPRKNPIPLLNTLAWFWTDLAAFAGIGGLWVAGFLRLLRQAPLVPLNDPVMLAIQANPEHHEAIEESGHVHGTREG